VAAARQYALDEPRIGLFADPVQEDAPMAVPRSNRPWYRLSTPSQSAEPTVVPFSMW